MKQQIEMSVQRGENDIEVTVYMYCDGGDCEDIYAHDVNGKEVLLTNTEIEAAIRQVFEEESEKNIDLRSEY